MLKRVLILLVLTLTQTGCSIVEVSYTPVPLDLTKSEDRAGRTQTGAPQNRRPPCR